MKSHSALLTGYRAKLLEFKESLAGFKRHIDELYGTAQALEERQAELQEGQNRSLDKLEAMLELIVPRQFPPAQAKEQMQRFQFAWMTLLPKRKPSPWPPLVWRGREARHPRGNRMLWYITLLKAFVCSCIAAEMIPHTREG